MEKIELICIDDDCVQEGYRRKSFMKKGWKTYIDERHMSSYPVGSITILLEGNKYGINFHGSAFRKISKEIQYEVY